MNFFLRMSLFLIFALIFSFAFPAWVSSEDLIHVVGKGDTIYSISRFYSVNADDLMKANNISDPSKLQVGAKLKIPISASSALPAQGPTLALTDYRVVRGDTLFGIARKHDITLANLQEINKFPSNHVIKIGDVIKVPAKTAERPTDLAAEGSTKAAITNAQPKGLTPPDNTGSATDTASGIYALRWPVTPKDITYMTGQMGVVVAGELNESVKSLTSGKVISAGPWRKFGRVVIVETDGGYFYMYGGCETLSVKVGDKVTPGNEVGKLGLNTVSEKPQLFFMVFRNDLPIDPAKAPRAGGNGRI